MNRQRLTKTITKMILITRISLVSIYTSDSRRRLRSASTSALVVPPTRRRTIGLLQGHVSGTRFHLLSLTPFKRHLKTTSLRGPFLETETS